MDVQGMVKHNFAVAKQYFSMQVLEQKLLAVINAF
jgi:hypothetical protein